jgi:hypothetical protein
VGRRVVGDRANVAAFGQPFGGGGVVLRGGARPVSADLVQDDNAHLQGSRVWLGRAVPRRPAGGCCGAAFAGGLAGVVPAAQRGEVAFVVVVARPDMVNVGGRLNAPGAIGAGRGAAVPVAGEHAGASSRPVGG